MKFLPTSLLLLLALSLHLSGQPVTREDRPLVRALREGEILADRGFYSDAIIEVERAVDSTSPAEHLADAFHFLAGANFASKRYRPARASAERFLNGYPGDIRRPEVEYIYGISAYQSGEVTDARRALAASAFHSEKYRYESYYWLARINAEEGHLDSAERFARAALRKEGNEFRDHAIYLIAWINEGREEIDTAAAYYRRIVEESPNSDLLIDAQLRLGVIDARRGNYASAARLLNSLTPRSERQREEQLFYLGEASSALERHDEALRNYQEFVRDFPSSPRIRAARYGIGWSNLQLKHYDEAIATFRTLEEGIDSIAAASSYQIGAIEVNRGDTAAATHTFQSLLHRLPYESFSDNANYQLGRIHYRQGNYDSARHYFLVTARQFPESDVRADAYYLLGESYAALNDPNNAAYAFSRSRKVGASGDLYRSALFREGVMLYRSGRFRSAVDRFREYVSEHPQGSEIADATFWLGEALFQDRSYPEAERYYNAYLERYPTEHWREQSLYGLAWSRFQQQDFDRAALAFDDFVRNNPKSPLAVDATLRLADSYRLLKKYDKALATYDLIGASGGKGARDEEARTRRAQIFLQMGEIDRSVQTFRDLVRDYPKSQLRDVYAFNIGSIYRTQEMDTLAIAEFQKFLLTWPESQLAPQATFLTGDAWYNMENYDSALVYYRRVLDQYPSSPIIPEALDAVRFTLNATGRGREAVAIIDSFAVRNPDRLPADSLAFRKAAIILEDGDFAGAMERYRGLIRDFPQSPLVPNALFQIGRSYEYQGKTDSALVLYRQVLDSYSSSPVAEEALIEGAGLKLGTGRWSAAEDDYRKFVEGYSESDRMNEARYGIARARLGMADTTGALAGFQLVLDSGKATDEDLFVDRSRIETARIIAGRGERGRALELLAAVVARRRDDLAAEALLLRGRYFVEERDLSGALGELRRLTTEFNTFLDFAEPGMLKLGELYELLTNYESARETYKRLIAQTENAAIRTQAELRLKKLKQ